MTNPLGFGNNNSSNDDSDGMLHVLQGAQQGRSFPLETPEMTLGREGGALDLSDYRQMSREHARLFFENGCWSVQDCGSTNGTHVNGQRVATRRLQDGDILKMGDFSARVSLPHQAGSTPGGNRTELATDFDSPPTQLVPPAPQNFPQQNFPPQNPQYPWPAQNAPQFPPPQSPPQNYPPTQPNYQVHHYHTSGNVSTTGQTLGTVALCVMLVGLVPCFGWISWFTVLLGGAGAVVSLIDLTSNQNPSAKNSATTGLILSLVAVGIGAVRLVIGAGVC
jgi:pSer/pThr/pTyr-binding forkhead associated (FHA) protein